MSFYPEDGGAWGCPISAHRHNWNGSICDAPTEWNCGASSDFRESYCQQGDGRCFARSTFQPQGPHLIVGANGIEWLLKEDETSFEDQVLFLYTQVFREPHGIVQAHGRREYIIAGAYIIDFVKQIEFTHKSIYELYPKHFVYTADLEIKAPRFRTVGRPYFVHFDRSSVSRLLQALQAKLHLREKENPPHYRDFVERLPDYIDAASERNRTLETQLRKKEATTFATRKQTTTSSFHNPFQKGLQNVQPVKAPVAPPVSEEPTKEEPIKKAPPPPSPPQTLPALFDFDTLYNKASMYGIDALRTLWLGGYRKNALILLHGPPGIGKSNLANELVAKDRRHVVAVSPTWRGTEDLMGYVNPINGQLQPTSLCDFLHRAEKAWRAGDRNPFLVLFEEFNLSPPEYWFSEILVRSQYPIDEELGRTIEFGGKSPEHWETNESKIWLSPAIRFIATINTDHTTQRLSPRVLDRSTLIHVELSPEHILESLDIHISNQQQEAIFGLHAQLRHHGGTFSMRTAVDLKNGVAHCEQLGISEWEMIDLLLCSRLLSKVRLYAGEAGDLESILELNEKWAEDYGEHLPMCLAYLEKWRESLENGLDVIQA
ncbi:MAG TPA: hypothetical protein DCE42_14335 [Myxococcales bacterium]|nr:hypothetical protein [Deltaproteobacteria bacterium]MBU48392.1 hypothetical protein [Deltaproteobacteria bacterium]HAA55938.1 hypothetical protein [Myxococcales bacterium]|tara:strand:+ start:3994 stop:5796 length:1803 start_codon:yes stop_codon:yes gene_type:complete